MSGLHIARALRGTASEEEDGRVLRPSAPAAGGLRRGRSCRLAFLLPYTQGRRTPGAADCVPGGACAFLPLRAFCFAYLLRLSLWLQPLAVLGRRKSQAWGGGRRRARSPDPRSAPIPPAFCTLPFFFPPFLFPLPFYFFLSSPPFFPPFLAWLDQSFGISCRRLPKQLSGRGP